LQNQETGKRKAITTRRYPNLHLVLVEHCIEDWHRTSVAGDLEREGHLEERRRNLRNHQQNFLVEELRKGSFHLEEAAVEAG